ncbi:alpha/beta fold hydrolase [Enhygromyxa salina]|uniref:2-hydroxymuconate semialdehyde hydrolase n=1 Tax=Enhygromyxa salina TaxID=215803 RepID=A0A2S9YNY9_9BACT|nr:alpha/beta hydrolase [Enhygromyxa salina]PRQ06813.1 2-hydroxymuconate semialdehyde hydrolase [Enhygromyxa salina]
MLENNWISLGIAAALLVSAGGCNVVTMTEHQLERRFTRAELSAQTLDTEGIAIAYHDGGADKSSEHTPVLLLHGFGASAIWQWPHQVEALAETRRVIVPDLLWFGDSIADAQDFSLDAQVHAVQLLLNELELGQVDVVGVSYGGLVAHELAVNEPDRVRKLVIVDSPGRAFSLAEYRALCDRFDVDSAADFLIPKDEAGVQVLLELAYERPPKAPGWAKRQILAGLYVKHSAQKAALIDTLVADIDGFTSRPLPAPRPTLVVWGEHDPVFPLDAGQRLSTMLDATLVVIPNARHAPNMEHPKPFNRALIEFLDE